MSEFTFVDELPPARPRPADLFRQFADVLRANPGRWAEWPTKIKSMSAGSTASRINLGLNPTLPATEFEAVAREYVVYVRCIGTGAARA